MFFKTPKNLCTAPKRLTEREYVPHEDETQIVIFE
jgi:hypothetical protein